MKIGKYEFDNKEQAESKIDALGVATNESGDTYPVHNHSVVKLGNIVVKQPTYDEYGKILTKAVFSDKYSVDVIWSNDDGHPFGWKSYAINVSGNGIHSFAGIDYNDYKI